MNDVLNIRKKRKGRIMAQTFHYRCNHCELVIQHNGNIEEGMARLDSHKQIHINKNTEKLGELIDDMGKTIQDISTAINKLANGRK